MTESIEKSWGKETTFAQTEVYNGKFLEFSKSGNSTSLHLHRFRDKTLLVLNGMFLLTVVSPLNAESETVTLRTGDSWRMLPMIPHRIEAIEDNSVIIEVSTSQVDPDTYRVQP